MPHRIAARALASVPGPPVQTRHDIIQSFLSDAAHVPGGFAAGVAFPRTAAEVASLVAAVRRVLPIGAQSSLTGGATPRGELVLSTRELTAIALEPGALVRVEAGVTLSQLQRTLAAHSLYYPPVPTFDGAFVGGTVATNAAGAATFKYGSTRSWVQAIEVVLADASLLRVQRGEATASPAGEFEVGLPTGVTWRVPIPSYRMPDVPKLSAGYCSRPGMDLVDLFVGSEGTLGIVVAATLRTVPLPRNAFVLVPCDSDAQAIALTGALRREAALCWSANGPLDVSAIEYMDQRALDAVPQETFSRTGLEHLRSSRALLLIHLELPPSPRPVFGATGPADEREALQRLEAVLGHHGIGADVDIALPGDSRAAARMLHVREAIPAAVNARVAAAQAAIHPEIQKTAGDLVVPFERLADSIALYRECFESRGLDYALWGHASDGNLHPNVIPRSLDDVRRGREAILDAARRVIAMGGAPLAEHGVGRSPLKQQLLEELYGAKGIEEMRTVKRALDPEWKLAPGVLFAESG